MAAWVCANIPWIPVKVNRITMPPYNWVRMTIPSQTSMNGRLYCHPYVCRFLLQYVIAGLWPKRAGISCVYYRGNRTENTVAGQRGAAQTPREHALLLMR